MTVIPARMASTRLPGKPLADINGLPMIVRVWRQAMESGLGDAVVACGEQEIADVVKAHGGQAVLTRPDHPSGSDRVYEAVQALDPKGDAKIIVNLQGDLPTIAPEALRETVTVLEHLNTDIATLVAEITDAGERTDPNVVKAVLGVSPGQTRGRALYFSRATVPTGDGPLFHHIGIYAYRREALARFVGLPPSPLEQRERLEQLRALEAGMSIGAGLVDAVPLGVDTPEDLERARALTQDEGK